MRFEVTTKAEFDALMKKHPQLRAYLDPTCTKTHAVLTDGKVGDMPGRTWNDGCRFYLHPKG